MIGYYVHHQGSGHLLRATAIAHALGEPVIGLSSLPPQPGFAGWVTLDRDDGDPAAPDVTASGRLHWAPRGDAGLLGRMAALAAWVERYRPAAVVVDVSVEVAALVRLLGVPVVVVALPGDRDDPAHQLGYGLAAAVLACWPREVYDPVWLRPHADRVHYVGAISRFDGRRRAPVLRHPRPYGVVLGGSGGSDVTAADVTSLPGDLDWELLLPGPGWRSDPWPVLCGAAVVVTHAGQNAVADVAAAGRPAVVVPQARPHREQHRTAEALDAAGLAAAVPHWPAPADWSGALDRARGLGGSEWSRWHSGRGAARAAAVVSAVAAGTG